MYRTSYLQAFSARKELMTYDPANLPPRRPSHPRATPARRRAGFTLMETALATVIVGFSVIAVVQLITVTTKQNYFAQKTTTALMLADQIREGCARLPFCDPANGVHLGPNNGATLPSQFNDVEDFSGLTVSPPVDSLGQPLTQFAKWQQQVTITHVSPGLFTLTQANATDQTVVLDRITVTISYNDTPANSSTWAPIATLEFLKSRY